MIEEAENWKRICLENLLQGNLFSGIFYPRHIREVNSINLIKIKLLIFEELKKEARDRG